MKQLIFLGMVVMLASCGNPQAATLAPTQEAIQVTYQEALQPWADRLSTCASGNPLAALFFSQSPPPDPAIYSAVLQLNLGEPDETNAHAHLYQVGWEQVVVVVNQGNSVSSLSPGDLQSIYSGQTISWENNPSRLIQVWVLPQDDPVRKIFDQVVMPSQVLASEAMLAPDPQAMLEAISTQDNAIGYLPRSFLTSNDSTLVSKVKAIQLDTSVESELRLPVIVITPDEPQGLVRELIACLQSPGG